jgi:hypothetical protein
MAKSPKIIVQKATAFQLTPGKGYIVHAPGLTDEEQKRLQEWFKEHGIEDAVIMMTDEFNITELPNAG